jgi:hypothetical protein
MPDGEIASHVEISYACVRSAPEIDTAANTTRLEQTLQIQVEEESGFNRCAGEQIGRHSNGGGRSPTFADGGIGFGGSVLRLASGGIPSRRTAYRRVARALTLLRKAALKFQVAIGANRNASEKMAPRAS